MTVVAVSVNLGGMNPAAEALQLQVETLKAEVTSLTEEVASLRAEQHSVNTHTAAMGTRVEALEKRFAAMEQRMTHIDHLLGQLQVDIRRLQRQGEELKERFSLLQLDLKDLRTEFSSKMDEANALLKRMLDLLQPKVVVGNGA